MQNKRYNKSVEGDGHIYIYTHHTYIHTSTPYTYIILRYSIGISIRNQTSDEMTKYMAMYHQHHYHSFDKMKKAKKKKRCETNRSEQN